jgi:hypothetical protein
MDEVSKVLLKTCAVERAEKLRPRLSTVESFIVNERGEANFENFLNEKIADFETGKSS